MYIYYLNSSKGQKSDMYLELKLESASKHFFLKAPGRIALLTHLSHCQDSFP